jgi:hypothetical protein
MTKHQMSRDKPADFLGDLTRSFLGNEMLAVPDSFEGVLLRFNAFFLEFKLHLVGASMLGKQSLLLWAMQLRLDASSLAYEPADVLDFLDDAITDLKLQYPAISPSIGLYRTTIPSYVAEIPTMSNPLTLQYYRWLGRQYRGDGDIVELGTWLGASTAALAAGTKDILAEKRRSIYCFDSFRWEPWMNRFKQNFQGLHLAVSNGESYLDYFMKYCAPVKDHVHAQECYLSTKAEDNVYNLPPFSWAERPIEILVCDIGSDAAEINAIWDICGPFLIPGRSIIIFQEFGKVGSHAIRQFCYRKHELRVLHGPIGTLRAFRFEGNVSR